MTIYNCDPSELVDKASEELKRLTAVKAPEWAPFVKTGVHRERPPIKSDWWHTRAASVLRQIYIHGPIGVSKLRSKYGGKMNRGYKPPHFYKGSGSIIRKILQQLEKAGFIKKGQAGGHKGRVITAEGKKFMDSIASKISVQIPVAEKVHAEEKSENKEEAKAAKKSKKAKEEIKAESQEEPKEKIQHKKAEESA